MHIKTTCLIILLMLCMACKEDQKEIELDYADIVKTLQTTETKVAYLSGVYNQDLKLKDELAEAIQKFGYNSAQHQEVIDASNKAFALNLKKIEAYLQVFGFPDKKILKTNSVDAVYNILHGSNDLDVKARNFKYLYGAYRNKKLPGGSLAFFLHKYYELQSGERMKLQSPFTESFELDTLIRSLGLDLSQISY